MKAKTSSDSKKEAPRIKLTAAIQLVLFSICTIGAMRCRAEEYKAKRKGAAD